MILRNSEVHIVGSTKMRNLTDWASQQKELFLLLCDLTTPLAKMNEKRTVANMVEFAGRHCYRSWGKGRETQAYIDNIIEEDHGSVLEHVTVNLALSGLSRSCTHELVRHRVGAAVSQESQRYVNAKDINFVLPPLYCYWDHEDMIKRWEVICEQARYEYINFTENLGLDGVKETVERKRIIEAARSLLPNAAETRMTWTPNIRTLRHFFYKRGAKGADLEIRRLAVNIFCEVSHDIEPWQMFLQDLTVVPGDFGVPCIVNVDDA